MPNQPTGKARTIVITGGTSGIGHACAAAILTSYDGPWHVVLPSRDAGRGKAAVDKLAGAAVAANTVEAMPLDLASLASVRAFAAELAGRASAAARGTPGDRPPAVPAVSRCRARRRQDRAVTLVPVRHRRRDVTVTEAGSRALSGRRGPDPIGARRTSQQAGHYQELPMSLRRALNGRPVTLDEHGEPCYECLVGRHDLPGGMIACVK
jgi:NAD(P)-dependent dehydrogenase (short-subunit alcohol dehydrogenase family)